MEIGMLWFDNDQQHGLIANIRRAAEYYQRKYGQEPSLCFIHNSMLPADLQGGSSKEMHAGSVEVRAVPWMLPNHFWIGVKGNKAELSPIISLAR